MQKDWHTADTRNQIRVHLPFIELARVRPKIAQRRTSNRALINALKSYDLNRRTAAEALAFEHVKANA